MYCGQPTVTAAGAALAPHSWDKSTPPASPYSTVSLRARANELCLNTRVLPAVIRSLSGPGTMRSQRPHVPPW